MKGKYTNAAERRRHLEDLAQRVEAAERRAEQLEAELDKLSTASERQIGGLRLQVADLTRQRDAVVSPELQAATEQIEAHRRRIFELKGFEAGLRSSFGVQIRTFVRALRDRGASKADIKGIMAHSGVELGEVGLDAASFVALAFDREVIERPLTEETE